MRMRETEGNAMSDLHDLAKRAVACKGWRAYGPQFARRMFAGVTKLIERKP